MVRTHECPSTVRPAARPLPESREALLRADGCQPPALVPPSWFLPTSTACSTLRLRACCIPLPVLGFAAFPVANDRRLPKESRTTVPFPATRFVPFEGFPSSTAVPHHCGRCPLAVSARIAGRTSSGSGVAQPTVMLRFRWGGLSTSPSEVGALRATSGCHARIPGLRGQCSEVRVSRRSSVSGRLQGVAPSTNPLRSTVVCGRHIARSSHGLCSPPRSSFLRSRPPGREPRHPFPGDGSWRGHAAASREWSSQRASLQGFPGAEVRPRPYRWQPVPPKSVRR
jgi:hypothetical protein